MVYGNHVGEEILALCILDILHVVEMRNRIFFRKNLMLQFEQTNNYLI